MFIALAGFLALQGVSLLVHVAHARQVCNANDVEKMEHVEVEESIVTMLQKRKNTSADKTAKLVLETETCIPSYNASQPKQACKALSYPRTLTGAFNHSDIVYLEQLFFNKPNFFSDLGGQGHMFNPLWLHLNETRDATLLHILDKLSKFLQTHFGDEFLLLDAFYSLRQKGWVQAKFTHQDKRFWYTANQDCSGFGFWVLLGHRELNTSFDVYEIDKNHYLYQDIDLYAPTGLQKSSWADRLRHPSEPLQKTRLPMSVNEGLVLKQFEIHVTDQDPLSDKQWRLALSTRMVKKGPIECREGHDSFFDTMNETRLPSFAAGDPVWSPYDPKILNDYWFQLDSML